MISLRGQTVRCTVSWAATGADEQYQWPQHLMWEQESCRESVFIPCCTNSELKFDFYFWFAARCLCSAPLVVVLAAEDMLGDGLCCWAMGCVVGRRFVLIHGGPGGS